ncbi:MAG TPA: 16S rRNA (adenine(1518)-N(6)/adenine(1519)-N(6))-dimethyltransferase RsmA [Caulobacteraceae bacterium]
MSLTDLPPLGEALKAAGLQADKSFGQHFLLDLNLCRKIVRIAEVANGETVLEIGPGPGGLTRTLLAAGARVVAIEQDRRFAALLEPLAEAAEGRLKIVYADALTADEAALAGAYASIVANLPYNVGTPLLIKWLTGVWRPARLTLMYQLEVASRIVAAPGSADYGRLAVIVQALAEARIALKLPARAFTPPPKVDSAVVRIDPRADPPADALIEVLQRVTAAAFGQRRKMLRSSLKPLGGAALCEAVGIAPDRRAETLSVDAFLALAAHVASDRR